jgi:hypothetical protein
MTLPLSTEAFYLTVFYVHLVGKPRSRWEHHIKIDLTEIGWGGVDWIHLAEDRDQRRALVNSV